MDELTALIERHPGLVNIPSIMAVLAFAVFVFCFGCRRTLALRPGQFGKTLAACFKAGSYLMVVCCLWGGVLLGTQTSLAKQNWPINPILAAVVGLSWLLIVVPCCLSKPVKKEPKTSLPPL